MLILCRQFIRLIVIAECAKEIIERNYCGEFLITASTELRDIRPLAIRRLQRVVQSNMYR